MNGTLQCTAHLDELMENGDDEGLAMDFDCTTTIVEMDARLFSWKWEVGQEARLRVLIPSARLV